MHLNEKLSGYLDGELDAAERAEVEAHLASCAECRALVERMRAMQSAAQAAEGGEADLDAATVDRFIAENKSLRDAHSGATAPNASAATPDSSSSTRRRMPESKPGTSRPTPKRPSRRSDFVTFGLATGLAAILVIATFVALGGPLRNMFANSVGEETMGQNQAALSAGIY
jgi:anti-sigma factor RsiW